ncbi:MAG: hypothetical protein ACK4UX_08795 [Thiobacillus sp.]
MNTRPSPDLPGWALAWFTKMGPRFDDAEEMPHRHDAFYRLFCTNDPGMRRMWTHVDRHVQAENRGALLHSLIYSMDDALEDEHRPLYRSPPAVPEKRLRDAAQRQARKLAMLIQELCTVTPPRCEAARHDVIKYGGSTVERLVIAYRIALAPIDINDIYRRHDIAFTSTSKRGWVQRRRASDAARRRVIAAARELAETGRPQDARWLGELADALHQLPDLKTEHAGQPELRSQKCGWPDWVRVAQAAMRDAGIGDACLRTVDWAALVRALFDDTDVSEVRVGQVLKETSATSTAPAVL